MAVCLYFLCTAFHTVEKSKCSLPQIGSPYKGDKSESSAFTDALSRVQGRKRMFALRNCDQLYRCVDLPAIKEPCRRGLGVA
jgi:hypothetical protein